MLWKLALVYLGPNAYASIDQQIEVRLRDNIVNGWESDSLIVNLHMEFS